MGSHALRYYGVEEVERLCTWIICLGRLGLATNLSVGVRWLIAKDLDAPANDPRPQIVAASLTAAFNALSERDEGSNAKPKSAAALAAAIDPVFTFLRGGLDALKR